MESCHQPPPPMSGHHGMIWLAVAQSRWPFILNVLVEPECHSHSVKTQSSLFTSHNTHLSSFTCHWLPLHVENRYPPALACFHSRHFNRRQSTGAVVYNHHSGPFRETHWHKIKQNHQQSDKITLAAKTKIKCLLWKKPARANHLKLIH